MRVRFEPPPEIDARGKLRDGWLDWLDWWTGTGAGYEYRGVQACRCQGVARFANLFLLCLTMQVACSQQVQQKLELCTYCTQLHVLVKYKTTRLIIRVHPEPNRTEL